MGSSRTGKGKNRTDGEEGCHSKALNLGVSGYFLGPLLFIFLIENVCVGYMPSC